VPAGQFLLELDPVGDVACVDDHAADVAVGAEIGQVRLDVPPGSGGVLQAELQRRGAAGGQRLLERGAVAVVDEAEEPGSGQLGARPAPAST
jgi:hypothetical protein